MGLLMGRWDGRCRIRDVKFLRSASPDHFGFIVGRLPRSREIFISVSVVPPVFQEVLQQRVMEDESAGQGGETSEVTTGGT